MATAIVMTVWGSSAVQDGLEVFDARMQESGGAQELMQRSRDTYFVTASALNRAPAFGLGIGLGTNAGNALVGADAFRFGESEWTRILYEAGFILGAAYIVWRLWLCARLLGLSVSAASIGHVFPIALLGASLTNLMLGPWGQPTTQGFAVLTAGLCFASCRVAAGEPVRARVSVAPRQPVVRKLASVYR